MQKKLNTAKGAKSPNTAGKQPTAGPKKSGQVLTSEKPLIQSTPAKPASQGGGVVGNYPLSFGVGGGGKIPGSGGPKKNGRKKQY